MESNEQILFATKLLVEEYFQRIKNRRYSKINTDELTLAQEEHLIKKKEEYFAISR